MLPAANPTAFAPANRLPSGIAIGGNGNGYAQL